MDVIILNTPELGDRSYIVHDGTDAVVIDPQRDIARVLDAARDNGLTIRAVGETHIHNDYVTGGLELATRLGVPYFVNEADEVSYERTPVSDGYTFRAGTFTVTVVSTPGHTPTHVSYLAVSDDGKAAVFTGGSLLYGSVGRPDLLGPEMTDFLARSQFRSVHRLADTLADEVEVQPTHGFGSFCSSSSCEAGSTSTIGNEKRSNFALLLDDEDEFKKVLLAGLDAWPAYYRYMGPANLAGPSAYFDEVPAELELAEVEAHLAKGSFVVDTRSAEEYAAGHIPGSHAIPLGNSFSTYLGWIVDRDRDVVLLTRNGEEALEASRQLARISYDSVVGFHRMPDGAAVEEPRTLSVAKFADLDQVRHKDSVAILDVRRNDERRNSFIQGSTHIPIHELPERLGELDGLRDKEVWVHCAGGYRATLASSILANAGHAVVCVNDDYAAYFSTHA
ncbi:MAG: MBL fold metallo-hydrolase [Actinomycetota bacterium]|nr:MBL fold metallo-hydrolase [Actinomycetota bacterium]